MQEFNILKSNALLKSLNGQVLSISQKYTKADKFLKESNSLFDQCLKQLTEITEQESEDLEVVIKLNNQIKEDYAKNLNQIGINLCSIDKSFCETLVACKKKAQEVYPHRIVNIFGNANDNKDLDSIESIVEIVKSTLNTSLDLKYLGIRGYEMKNNIIPAMLNNSNINNLTNLNLEYNKIGDSGANYLSQGLPRIPNLRIINLGGNKIGTDGMQSLCQPLRVCSAIRLHVNNLTKESSQFIANLIQNNERLNVLHLYSNPLAGGLKPIIQATKTCPNMTATTLQEIKSLARAESDFKEQLQSDYKSHPQTTYHSRQDEEEEEEMVDEFTAQLSTKVKLLCFGSNHLNLTKAKFISFYEAIKKNKDLEDFTLSKNKISGHYLAQSIQNNQALKSLDIADAQITPQGMLQLANAIATTKITSLRIGLNNIGSDDQGIEAIKVLLLNSQLVNLDINGIGLGDSGLKRIINELKNSKIKKIDLSSNELTDEGGKLLSSIQNKKIIALDNEIEDSQILENVNLLGQYGDV